MSISYTPCQKEVYADKGLERDYKRLAAASVATAQIQQRKVQATNDARKREVLGISVTAFADACRVSEGAIRQIESGGVKSPSLLLGLRMAKALDVAPYRLGTGRPEPLEDRLMRIESRLTALEKHR